jgi:hypothetical protein
MRINFQDLASFVSAPEQTDTRARTPSIEPAPQPIRPRPIDNPDYVAIRKKVMTRFSKTLAYLAK